MTDFPGSDRRRHSRYDTDVQVKFYVSFDIETKVDYRVKDKTRQEYSSLKYNAVSHNVSVEGLAFYSEKKLTPGDILSLEVYIPSAATPVKMEGEVRWSMAAEIDSKHYPKFETGVRILAVEGTAVEKSIFFDDVHKITWSIVLESVFGNFKHLILRRVK